MNFFERKKINEKKGDNWNKEEKKEEKKRKKKRAENDNTFLADSLEVQSSSYVDSVGRKEDAKEKRSVFSSDQKS